MQLEDENEKLDEVVGVISSLVVVVLAYSCCSSVYRYLTTIVPMSPTGLGLECYHLHELTTTPLGGCHIEVLARSRGGFPS